MKTCSKCKIQKPFEEFYPRTNRGKKTLASDCKSCAKLRNLGLQAIGQGSWHAMKDRCLNVSGREYKRYGAKGIFICKGLASSFKYFLSIIGEKPDPAASVDRTNNNGNYTCGICDDCVTHAWPLNIRWATKKEQIHNRNPYITTKRKPYSGITKLGNKWQVNVSIKGKDCYVGVYSLFDNAKLARDAYLSEYNRL